MNFPNFDAHFPDLDGFVKALVEEYQSGKIQSWDDLAERVSAYFTLERMHQMESLVPGWQKMASYSGGITLVHVMCVFLGLFMLPEFQRLTPDHKQLAKWIVLFHDVDKFHIKGKKDTMHAFRSAVHAARTLPKFGFRVTGKYDELIDSWSEYTAEAFLAEDGTTTPKPNNTKLPEILTGVERLYGEDTPATLIIKTILFHTSFHEDDEYPTPAPLTDDEIKRYIRPSLVPFSRVMMMADNEGWTLFEPEYRGRFYEAALAFFERVEKLIAANPDQ
jgi:hypothetical protein